MQQTLRVNSVADAYIVAAPYYDYGKLSSYLLLLRLMIMVSYHHICCLNLSGSCAKNYFDKY